VPADNSKPENWSSEDKLAVVIETAALSGYQHNEQGKKEKVRNRQDDKKKIRELESALRRKEKALAETAALLVLSKKCEAIWGGEEK